METDFAKRANLSSDGTFPVQTSKATNFGREGFSFGNGFLFILVKLNFCHPFSVTRHKS